MPLPRSAASWGFSVSGSTISSVTLEPAEVMPMIVADNNQRNGLFLRLGHFQRKHNI